MTSHHGLPIALATSHSSTSDGCIGPKSLDADRQTPPLLLTCASCGATKAVRAFVNVDQEVVCDDCRAQDARAGDGPTCIHCGDPCQDRTCPACHDAGEDAALDAAGALPDEQALAAMIAALPFTGTSRAPGALPTRTNELDQRVGYGDGFSADAWVCSASHLFWAAEGHTPLTCPLCDTPGSPCAPMGAWMVS